MAASRPTSILVDLTQFESVAQAKSVIGRSQGFDDCVKQDLTAAIDKSEAFTSDLAFVLSSISRSRALHESIVREIGHDNPQAVFTLMRQFAETVALIRYTADHSRYFDTVVRDPQDLQPGMMRHRSTQALINHMDATYSTQFKLVYSTLCDMSHFGALAVWNAHRIEPEEEMRTSWSSAPRWRSEEECLIACAQLLELSNEMELCLKALIRAYLDRQQARTEAE
jgi:hypothetical protein